MSKTGRPRKYNRKQLLIDFARYIEETEIPIAAQFAARNGFGKSLLYEWEEFSELLKLCTTKKEAALEQKALAGDINVTMAIFSLKQLGWSDRQETTHRGDAAHPLVISASDAKL